MRSSLAGGVPRRLSILRSASRSMRRGWRTSPTARRRISMRPPVIVAEIGCNHRGELATAEEMVRVAARVCGVDVVKFQKRNPRECLTPQQYEAPHPVPANAYGDTYGAHREALEFSLDEHRRLKDLCEEWGVRYSS